MGFEQSCTLFALDQAHRDTLTQAAHRAPHVRLHTGQTGRARQAQGKVLLLVHWAISIGQHSLHKRPAGTETEPLRSVELSAFRRLQTGLDLHAATHTGRKVCLEIKNPGALVQPPPSALGHQAIGAAQVDRCIGLGVTETGGSFVKFQHHLPHPRDLALRRQTGNLECLCAKGGQCQCASKYASLHAHSHKRETVGAHHADIVGPLGCHRATKTRALSALSQVCAFDCQREFGG